MVRSRNGEVVDYRGPARSYIGLELAQYCL